MDSGTPFSYSYRRTKRCTRALHQESNVTDRDRSSEDHKLSKASRCGELLCKRHQKAQRGTPLTGGDHLQTQRSAPGCGQRTQHSNDLVHMGLLTGELCFKADGPAIHPLQRLPLQPSHHMWGFRADSALHHDDPKTACLRGFKENTARTLKYRKPACLPTE